MEKTDGAVDNINFHFNVALIVSGFLLEAGNIVQIERQRKSQTQKSVAFCYDAKNKKRRFSCDSSFR